MIHLTNKITSLLPELQAKGFNGVRFEVLDLEESLLEDCLSDGLTKADWEKRQRDYVAFIAQPRFPSYEESPYIEIDISVVKFEKDFRAWLKEQLGADVRIGYSEGCFEWECYRG